MPGLAVGNILSVILESRLNGQQILLTTHWRIKETGAALEVDMYETFDSLNNTFNEVDGWIALAAACMSQDTEILFVRYQEIYPDRRVNFGFDATNDFGAVAEDSMPPNVALVITVRTDETGPAERGNKHIGGLPVTFVENGAPSGDAIVALGQLGDALVREYVATVGGEDCVFEPILYRRDTPLSSPVVTNHILGQTSRTMHRRTVGLGS